MPAFQFNEWDTVAEEMRTTMPQCTSCILLRLQLSNLTFIGNDATDTTVVSYFCHSGRMLFYEVHNINIELLGNSFWIVGSWFWV